MTAGDRGRMGEREKGREQERERAGGEKGRERERERASGGRERGR